MARAAIRPKPRTSYHGPFWIHGSPFGGGCGGKANVRAYGESHLCDLLR